MKYYLSELAVVLKQASTCQGSRQDSEQGQAGGADSPSVFSQAIPKYLLFRVPQPFAPGQIRTNGTN